MTKLADLISDDNPADYSIEYRTHATIRMFRRDIHEDDIEFVLNNGNIIERYDNDFPLPSLLINGRTPAGRPLHIVAAINHVGRKIIIITTYEPDTSKWTADFSGRII